MTVVTPLEVQGWLIERIADRLGVNQSEIRPELHFDELKLDSTETLILAGEMENWLGFELAATMLWYHPTIEELAAYVAEECTQNAASA